MGKPQINNSGNVPYRKGYYEVKNKEKYMGNPLDCIYRSSWEYYFNIFLDHSSRVKKWKSEPEEYNIPYTDSKGKTKKYIPDYYAEFINPSDPNKVVQSLIEIKPLNEISPKFIKIDENGREKVDVPKSFKDLKAFENFEYQLKTYEKNRLKWQAAREFCRKRHMNFWLIHEKKLKELGILK